MKQTALKEMYRQSTCVIGTSKPVGIVSKELPGIGCRTNVFLYIAAVLTLQVGLMVHTRQSPKVQFLEKNVFIGGEAAVIGVISLKKRTVVPIMSISYKSDRPAGCSTVVTPALVSQIRNLTSLDRTQNDVLTSYKTIKQQERIN